MNGSSLAPTWASRASRAMYPTTLADAAALWRDAPEESVLLGGGTGLLAFSGHGRAQGPADVLSLRAIGGEFRTFTRREKALVIGGGVSLAAIAGDPGAENHDVEVPTILRQVAASVAFPAIRRTATLAGNLMNGVMPTQLFPVLFATNTTVITLDAAGEGTLDAQPEASCLGRLRLPHRALIRDIQLWGGAVDCRQAATVVTRPLRRRYIIAATFHEEHGLRASMLTEKGWWGWVRTIQNPRGLTEAEVGTYTDAFDRDAAGTASHDAVERLLQRSLLRRTLGQLRKTERGTSDE